MGCETTPLGQSNGRPPAIIAQKVRDFASAELDAGLTCRGELGNLPQRLPDGRYGHLIGFEIRFQFDEIAINATTLAAAIAGHELYGLLQEFKLRAGGHDYFGRNIDGRHLRLDYVKRNGVLCIDDPADIPDTGDTDVEGHVRFRYLFGSHGRPKAMMDNAIPLAMLDHRKDGNDILSWRLGTDFRGNAGISGATTPAAASLYDDLTLYALLAYTEDPYLDAQWHLTEDRTSLTQHTVERAYPDRACVLEYATLHSMVEDGGNADLDTEYAGTHTIMHGDYLYAAALDADELDLMQRLVFETDHIGDRATKSVAQADLVGGNAASTLAAPLNPAQIDLVALRPHSNRSDMAVPPIFWKTSTAAAAITSSRIMHRQVYPSSDAWKRTVLCRWGREVGFIGALPGGTVDIEKDLLPNRVTTPTTAIALVQAKEAPI